ncbi:hypothetical protein MTO96_025418 [Rhipicephalus appendiculatus]
MTAREKIRFDLRGWERWGAPASAGARTSANSKRKSQSQPGVSGRVSSRQHDGFRTLAARIVKKRLAVASRLAHPLREPFRIIVRPKGGMDVRRISQIKVTLALATAAQLALAETKEDIVCANVVVCANVCANARAYVRVEALLVASARYEINSYLAAPDNTCQGIARGFDLDLSDGQKVPNYVMCGDSMLRCALYRRQTDPWYACERLGSPFRRVPSPGVQDLQGMRNCLFYRGRPRVLAQVCTLRETSSHCGRGLQATLPSALRRPHRPTASSLQRRRQSTLKGRPTAARRAFGN